MTATTTLITGGTGFVMSNLARYLLESDPEASVVVLDSAPWDATIERFFEPVSERLPRLRRLLLLHPE